ncbi:MAG: RnfABCDGE type electron transport complex subunit B [Ruminococcaceae bacterium]|nr:RnfABCDGE type electron transport complex subunit B [Oscillospiraceae bacterium]
MTSILIPVGIVAGIGLIAGAGLAIASALMAVPVDEKAEKITEVLPGANCGACGFSGCAGYAAALSKGEAKNGMCIPGGEDAAAAIAGIIGGSAAPVEKKTAVVHCLGTYDNTSDKIEYQGVNSCAAAMQLFGGVASCAFGCIGLGDCQRACPYGAVNVCNGVSTINANLCKGCGLCSKACPKGIISLEPVGKAFVYCSSRVKGGETRKVCKAGCIGCMRCTKVCETGAITVTDFCASVDSAKCTGCGKCVDVCPAHIVRLRG